MLIAGPIQSSEQAPLMVENEAMHALLHRIHGCGRIMRVCGALAGLGVPDGRACPDAASRRK